MANARSRGGCWTCRQKRRKCDENKPACKICQLSGIQCGGYEIQLAEFRAQGSYEGQMICRIVRGSEPDKQVIKPRKKKPTSARGIKAARKQTNPNQKASTTMQPQSQSSMSIQRNSMMTILPSAPSQSISSAQGLQEFSNDIMQDRTRNSDSGLGDSPDSIVQSTPSRDPDAMESAFSHQNTTETSDSAMTSSDDQYRISTSVGITDYDVFDAFGHGWLGSDGPSFQSSQDQDCDEFGPKISISPITAPTKRGSSTSVHPNMLTSSIRSQRAELNDTDVSTAQLELTRPGAEAAHPISREQEGEAAFVSLAEGPDPPSQAELFVDFDDYSSAEQIHVEKIATDVEQSTDRPPNHEILTARSRRNTPKNSMTCWDEPLHRISGLELSSPFDTYLYSHFFGVLAPSLYPVAPERNPYTCVYGKMAASCLPLRAAILEASARHLRGMGQLPPGVVTLYCDSSWQAFKSATSTWKQSVALAATLLLSITVEVVGSGTEQWTAKLHRARNFLVDHAFSSDTASAPVTTSFLRLQFNWMIAIGRVMQDDASLVDDMEQLDFIEDSMSDETFSYSQARWFSNLPDYKYFCFFKDATRFARTAALAQSSNYRSLRRLMPDVAELLQNIAAWQPDPSSVSAEYAAHTAHVNEVWRQGLLCYIYADICALPSSEHRIQECIRQASEAFQKLAWIQSVTWPMFMLGVHAILPAHRQVLEDSYIAMSTTLCFATPRSIVAFLHKVWAEMDSKETCDSRWRGVMKDTGIQLNVFL